MNRIGGCLDEILGQNESEVAIMTKIGASTSDGGRLCPDFETLSRFADEELDAGGVESVAAHLQGCARCEALTGRLRAGFGVLETVHAGGTGGAGCTGEESLILYVRNALSERERKGVEKHLATCDPCVAGLALLHGRLRMADGVGTAVPEAIRTRATQAFAASVESPVPSQALVVATRPGWLSRLGSVLSGLFRLPILVPVGVAAGAIVMVSVQDAWRGPLAPSDLSRSIDEQEVLRVTAPQARVWTAPTTRSEIVATVGKGTELRVAATERHWYQVVLPEGQVGWIERDAFE
jgi:anti-sigma factor RsiW